MSRSDGIIVHGFMNGLVMSAVESGDVDLCRYLVKSDISMCVRDTLGFGPLHIIGALDVELIDFLVANGVDPNSEADDGYTPLDYAIRNRDVGLCRELVRHGAESDYVAQRAESTYLTPFQKAVYCGFGRAIEFFVDECGEDPAQRTLDGRTMPQLSRKHPEIKLLLRSLKTRVEVRASVEDQSGAGAAVARRPAELKIL